MPAPTGHEPYNTNGEGGRPKKYTEEFIEAEATAFEAWIKDQKNVYFKRFAITRGYHPQRLSEFAEQNNRFSEAYKLAQAWQEVKLVEGGLSGKFNSSFTKFAMSNLCGWTDRTETKVSGDAANPLAFLMQKIDGSSKDLVNE